MPVAVPPAAPAPRNLAYLSQDDPGLAVTDAPANRFRIIDVHEHVRDEREGERLIRAMDALGIARSCLLAASWYTFTLDPRFGFERWQENNEAVLRLRDAHPDRFCAFVTIDPLAGDPLALVQQYVGRGADGLKLYLGHGGSTGGGPFHSMPLDDARLRPLWAWLERSQLPVMLHVNLGRYGDELVRVLDAFPQLRICIPHFGLSKSTRVRLDRLAALFARYPNLYSDVSFGWHRYEIEGFEALAKWRSRSKEFLERHADRFLFGADLVLEPSKPEGHALETLRAYRQLLETRAFRYFREPAFPMHGLALGDAALRQIYETTPARFLQLDAQGRLPDRRASALGPPGG